SNFTPYRILFLLIFTPLIHLATNLLAYVLKLKKVPW
ncbi:MAG: CDP-archaeol synthase, partial [Thermoplasmata archaeon]|nr:CDP-archaeol synthase [Thermoplasmata archaeon]